MATRLLSSDAGSRTAWEDFLAGSLRVRGRPFKASIEITRNCNFKCNMCAQSWSPEYQEYRPEFNMRPEVFERIAREIFPHLEYAHLQGYGETVISPHWPQILEMCRPFAGKLRFGLVTNLSRKTASLWRKMVELDFHIIFSCDGATRKTFESIRRLSDFEDILENLETIRQARREFGRGQLEFLVTLQGLNHREMPLFVDMAERYGARSVNYASVMGTVSRQLLSWQAWKGLSAKRIAAFAKGLAGRLAGAEESAPQLGNTAVGIYDLPRSRLLALKRETLRKADEKGIRVRFNDAYLERLGEPSSNGVAAPRPQVPSSDFREGIEESVKVATHQRCFKPYSYVVINYRGDIGLCNHLITDASWKQMGNLMTSSFDEIWNSEAYQEMRRRLNAAEPDNPSCQWCFRHRMTD